MEDLLSLIVSLRTRIERHGLDLRQSEALTRSVLIDPLLRELGWNTEDPSHVVPEFRVPSQQSRADYALFTGAGRPKVIVEAKKLGDSLIDAARQAVNYCTLDGYGCFAVTDGCRWVVYETLKPGVLDDKRVADFNLEEGTATAVCQAALSLWRQRFVDGMPPHVEPVVGEGGKMSPESELETPSEPQLGGLSGDWIRLSEFHPKSGIKPQGLRFPTGRTVTVASWTLLVVALVKWLSSEGHLPDTRLPIRRLVAKRGSDRGSDGKLLASAHKAGDLWVATKFGVKDHARNVRTIINQAGLNPGDFAVRLMN